MPLSRFLHKLTHSFSAITSRKPDHPQKIVTTPVFNQVTGVVDRFEAHFTPSYKKNSGWQVTRLRHHNELMTVRLRQAPFHTVDFPGVVDFLALEELKCIYLRAGINGHLLSATMPFHKLTPEEKDRVNLSVARISVGQQNNPTHLYNVCRTYPVADHARDEHIHLHRLLRLLERNKIIPHQQPAGLQALREIRLHPVDH